MAESGSIAFEWGARVPMRDGVTLGATVYRPAGDDPTPAVFTLTPYIADSYHDRGTYFARHGYAFVLVDCRGRGNSGGTFRPMRGEGPDGHDIVEWLAAQPWCDGSVAMWGGSYAGFDQWMTAREHPSHLRTIVPAASAAAAVDFPLWNNVGYSYEIQWQTFTSGVTPNEHLFSDQAFWIEKFREHRLAHRPFIELDTTVGNLASAFREDMSHPTPDAYWDEISLGQADHAAIGIPILTITGHYDDDQPGALHFYREHVRSATADARERHHLIIGPWDHPGTRTPARDVGGLTFGEASLVDLNALHVAWYDWTMRDGPKPDFLRDRVAYYVAGADEWRYASALEAIPTDTQAFYLASVGGQANDVFHSGALVDDPADSAPDTYVDDPLDDRVVEIEREPIERHLTDQRYVVSLFGAGVVYHTGAFETATELTGQIRLDAWIAMDVPDADFHVSLSEIERDGSSILLTETVARARYRVGLREEHLVEPGAILRYTFDGFHFFSRQIAVGSRLRLVIKAPNSIYWQQNYHGGGIVAEESGKDARVAHVTVYHDTAHPSRLELPVARPTEASAG